MVMVVEWQDACLAAAIRVKVNDEVAILCANREKPLCNKGGVSFELELEHVQPLSRIKLHVCLAVRVLFRCAG